MKQESQKSEVKGRDVSSGLKPWDKIHSCSFKRRRDSPVDVLTFDFQNILEGAEFMLRALRRQGGQAIMGEMVLTFAIVVAALIAMSAYVRRSYQGRILDADLLMLGAAGNALNGTVGLQYEPYYVNTSTRKDQYESERINVFGGGVHLRNTTKDTKQKSTSDQAPPHKSIGWW